MISFNFMYLGSDLQIQSHCGAGAPTEEFGDDNSVHIVPVKAGYRDINKTHKSTRAFLGKNPAPCPPADASVPAWMMGDPCLGCSRGTWHTCREDGAFQGPPPSTPVLAPQADRSLWLLTTAALSLSQQREWQGHPAHCPPST